MIFFYLIQDVILFNCTHHAKLSDEYYKWKKLVFLIFVGIDIIDFPTILISQFHPCQLSRLDQNRK